jgi:ABC-type amino acid transport substrate-binding protein
MQKPIRLLQLVLLSFSLSIPAFAGSVLKIAKMASPDHELIMRVVGKAYERLGVPVTFVEMPGKRALVESAKGSVDGELSRIHQVGEDHPSLVRVPTPVFYFEATAFTRELHFRVDGWQSLKGYRIGIERGMVYAENGTRGFPRVLSVDSPDSLFRLLELGRVDLVVYSDLNGIYMIHKQGLTSIRALSPGIERIEAYHYLHEKHASLVPKLDEIFKSMHANGEVEAMRKAFLEEITARPATAGPRP